MIEKVRGREEVLQSSGVSAVPVVEFRGAHNVHAA